MKRILVVEDEAWMARTLAEVLREEGYAPEVAGDGGTGLARAADGSLPDRSGVQVLRGLRAGGVGTPVLMLTARDQVEDRVEGLDAGADDYLPKPFALQELLARVRALTRRRAQPEDTDGTTVRAGDLILDPVRRVVRRGEERIELTAREFALLHAFMGRPGQVFTRSVLLDVVWGAPGEVQTNAVEMYVSYLRKKLDRRGEPSRIRTVRGVGYAFEPAGPGG